MHRYDTYEHLYLPHWRLTALKALFATATLRTLAYSLIGIFVPIFIYQVTGGLVEVLAYFALLRLVDLIANFPVVSWLPQVGFARSMLIGNILLIAHVLLLMAGATSLPLLYLSAVVAGVMIPFYWVPYHLIFTFDGVREKLGEEISFMAILGRLANVAGPFIGGIVIADFGFSMVYVVSAILLGIATIPIFLISEDFPVLKVPTLGESIDYLRDRAFRNDLVALSAIGAENSIQSAFWPLFLFIFIGGVEVVGGLTSVVLLLSVLLVWVIGRWVDSTDRAKVLGVGAVSNGVIWMGKILAQSFGTAFLVDSFYKATKSAVNIPFDAMIYEKARLAPVNYMLAREWAINGGRLLTMLGLIPLIGLGVNWLAAFALAAVASLGTVFLAREGGGPGRI